MQEQNLNQYSDEARRLAPPGSEGDDGSPVTGPTSYIAEQVRAAERARLRQGVMHVRIRHL